MLVKKENLLYFYNLKASSILSEPQDDSKDEVAKPPISK